MIIYENSANLFHLRLNAIIYNSDKTKVLIHKIQGYDFWLLPGGRLELMEDTKSAIIRELNEELDINFKVEEELAFINENFFNFSNKSYHEIGFFYKVLPIEEDQQKFENMCQKSVFTGMEGEKYIFKWIQLSDLKNINFKPSCIIENIIDGCNKEFSHNIIKEI